MASKSRWSFTGLFKRKPTDSAAKSRSKLDNTALSKSKQGLAGSNPFHAVSVVPGVNACAAAYRFTGQRFLSRQAPKLPLPTCDAAHCTCRFKHHRDRRAGPRRREEIGLVHGHWSGPERRRSGGRRAEDR